MMPGEFIIAMLRCRFIVAMYQLLKGVPFLRKIFFLKEFNKETTGLEAF